MKRKIDLILFFAVFFNVYLSFGQSKERPIPKSLPEIPKIEADFGYREIFTFEDTTKNLQQEAMLFLSNYYNSAKDVIDLNIDVNDQNTGIIVAKGKFNIPVNGFNVQGKKYYPNLTNYIVDHQVTIEIKEQRTRITLNNFSVQQPPLDYTDIMGNVTRIDYPLQSVQEMIDFTSISITDNDLPARINVTKQFSFSDLLNSLDLVCKAYLKEFEKFILKRDSDW